MCLVVPPEENGNLLPFLLKPGKIATIVINTATYSEYETLNGQAIQRHIQYAIN